MATLHPIDKITFMYGGIAYPEISDEEISKCLKDKEYHTDLKSITNSRTRKESIKRIAGIVHKIQKGTKFEIEIYYDIDYPYIADLYDGNHRLRAYQYLNQNIPVYFTPVDK